MSNSSGRGSAACLPCGRILVVGGYDERGTLWPTSQRGLSIYLSISFSLSISLSLSLFIIYIYIYIYIHTYIHILICIITLNLLTTYVYLSIYLSLLGSCGGFCAFAVSQLCTVPRVLHPQSSSTIFARERHIHHT